MTRNAACRLARRHACRVAGALLALLMLNQTGHADTARGYVAGMGDVDTRAFVIDYPEDQVRALLPAPLALNDAFPGKQAGRHPLILLFSVVMPRKAHGMPILIDMPYREFALFVPEVRHPGLQGVFLHSTILYLDSRPAVWIGRWPYRFPKIHARLPFNEGMKFGEWRILDGAGETPVIETAYELGEPSDADAARAAMEKLAAWLALPLINGTTQGFTCSRMHWELREPDRAESLRGTIQWRDDWLADTRRLPPPVGHVDGIRLRTHWSLSMPHACRRYRAEKE